VTQRHGTIGNEALVRWDVANKGNASLATIIDISESGALLQCEQLPGLRVPLMMRLTVPVKTDWIGARAVRFGENNEVGVEFTDRIPFDLILASTMGIDATALPMTLGDSDAETVVTD
jgi:hypothetical protein